MTQYQFEKALNEIKAARAELEARGEPTDDIDFTIQQLQDNNPPESFDMENGEQALDAYLQLPFLRLYRIKQIVNIVGGATFQDIRNEIEHHPEMYWTEPDMMTTTQPDGSQREQPKCGYKFDTKRIIQWLLTKPVDFRANLEAALSNA